MSPRISSVLPLLLAFILAMAGCDKGPSPADLERERVAHQQAEQARIEAEQRAQVERQRREDEQKKHESEKSQLWMYVVGVALIAIILLFLGTAVGSAARKDAEQERQKNDNRPPSTS